MHLSLSTEMITEAGAKNKRDSICTSRETGFEGGVSQANGFNKCDTSSSAKFSIFISAVAFYFPLLSVSQCHHRDGLNLKQSDMKNCRLKLFLSLPS